LALSPARPIKRAANSIRFGSVQGYRVATRVAGFCKGAGGGAQVVGGVAPMGGRACSHAWPSMLPPRAAGPAPATGGDLLPTGGRRCSQGPAEMLPRVARAAPTA
jgi:hypothetical protein